MLEVTSQEYYEELLSEIRVDVGHGEWEENSFFEKLNNSIDIKTIKIIKLTTVLVL